MNLRVFLFAFLLGGSVFSGILSGCLTAQPVSPVPEQTISISSSMSAAEADPEESRLLLAIQIAPQHWMGYLRLAEYYQQQQAPEKALVSLKRAQEVAPSSRFVIRALGSYYRTHEQIPQALALYTQAIQQFPQEPMFYLERSKLFWTQGQPAQALKDLEVALQYAADSFEVFFFQGLLLSAQGQAQEALKAFTRATELDPENSEAWRQISTIRESLGQRPEALQAMRRALELDPDQDLYLRYYASLLEKSGETKELEKVLTIFLRLYPNDAWGQAHYGYLAMQKGELEEARKRFLKAVEVQPDYAWAWLRLGTIYAQQKEIALAIGAFEKGLEFEPNNSLALKQLGILYEAQNRVEAAIEIYRQFLDQHTDKDPEVFHRLAQLYWLNLQFEPMLQTLQEGLEAFPKHPDLALMLARFYEYRQDLESARQAYLLVAETYPEDAQLLAHLGLIEKELGRSRKALNYWQQALKLSPNLGWVRLQLTSFYLQAGREDLAEAELRRIIREAPTSDWGFAQLGMLKMRQKNYAESATILKRGTTNNPQSAWLHELTGLLAEKRQQWEQALNAFKKAEQLKPNDPFLLSHQGFIYSRLGQWAAARETLLPVLLRDDLELWPWYQYNLAQDKTFQKLWFGSQWKGIRDILHEMVANQDLDHLEPLLKKFERPIRRVMESLVKLQQNEKEAALKKIRDLGTNELPPWAAFQVGYVYEVNREYDQALLYYRAVLQAIPDHVWTRARMSVIYDYQNRLHEGIGYLQAFVEQFPQSSWGVFRLAVNTSLQGNDQEAAVLYRRLLALNPKHAASLNNLAWLHLTSKDRNVHDVEKALGLAQQAVALEPSEEHLDTLAEAYFQTGQPDRAIETIKQAILRPNVQSPRLPYLLKQYARFRKGDLSVPPDESGTP